MKLLLLFALLAGLVFAEKARDWQTGKIVESGSQRMSEITGVNDNPYGNNVERRQWDDEHFVVDAGDRIIVISQEIRRMGGTTINFRVGKGARLAPGDTIQFAIERDSVYVLIEGKERKLHVDRITLKPTSQASGR